MPGAELDCAKCHADDRWKSAVAPRLRHLPRQRLLRHRHAHAAARSSASRATGACTSDATAPRSATSPPATVAVGQLLAQDAPDADRRRAVQQSATRRRAPGSRRSRRCTRSWRARAIARPAAHERSRSRGGSGANGTFVVGSDTPTLTFQLVDKSGRGRTDLKTNATLSAHRDRRRAHRRSPARLRAAHGQVAGHAHLRRATRHVHLRLPVAVPGAARWRRYNTTLPRPRPTRRAPTRCGST